MAVVVDRIAGGGGVSIPVSLTTSMGATTTDGILLGATNSATAGAQVFSPALHFQGSGWKTNATAGAMSVDWTIDAEPVQGAAAPTNQLHIKRSTNGAAYATAWLFGDDSLWGIGSNGTFKHASSFANIAFGVTDWQLLANNLYTCSGFLISWASNSTSAVTGVDTGLSRISAGVVGVGTGAAGSVAGVISATSHMRVPLTVATLPAGATRGYTCIVTDASNPTFLATVVGGASTIAPVFYDGAAWKVG